MTGDDMAQPIIADRDGSPETPDPFDTAIESVFQRLNALDAAMNTLTDARNELVEALDRAEPVAEALRDRPERAEVVGRFDELCVVAYRSLAMLKVESPFANAVAEGPPARGSSPQILAQLRARRDTLADSPRALRGARGGARPELRDGSDIREATPAEPSACANRGTTRAPALAPGKAAML